MHLNPEINNLPFDLPKNQSNVIKVIGVGGGGSNAINYMHSKGIKGVDFVVCNTDSQALENSRVENKIQLGISLTEGLGAGANPEIGEKAAMESFDDLKKMLETNTKMVFITAGMGGGTGTGCSPVIANYARETDALVVGVAVLPFKEEGSRRRNTALEGLKELKNSCHCVIELDNEKINEIKNGDYPMKKAFGVMSDLVAETVQSLAEVVTEPSTINVDFADLRKIIEAGGNAKVLYGDSEGSDPGSVLDSVLNNPLLGSHYKGAEAVLLHVAAGSEFSLNNCHEVLSALKYDLSDDVYIVFY